MMRLNWAHVQSWKFARLMWVQIYSLIVVGSAWLILNRNVVASLKLWVQGPERKIQDARETDPRRIGQQKKC